MSNEPESIPGLQAVPLSDDLVSLTNTETGESIVISKSEMYEEANTPSDTCQHCCEEPTTNIIEFRNLRTDEVRLRSLCDTCTNHILEWI